jgi:hypothetical protein
MVNKNYFQFDRKSLFNFWKTKTVNCFPNLNSSLLQARLWESSTVEHWSLLVVRIYCWRFPFTRFWRRRPLPVPKSGNVWPPSLDSSYQITARIRHKWWLVIFYNCFFSYKPNTKKYFYENHFLFRQKYFTTKNILYRNKHNIHKSSRYINIIRSGASALLEKYMESVIFKEYIILKLRLFCHNERRTNIGRHDTWCVTFARNFCYCDLFHKKVNSCYVYMNILFESQKRWVNPYGAQIYLQLF